MKLSDMIRGPVMYAGWLPANPWDRRKWRKLGVGGSMRFRAMPGVYGTLGVFEHCDVTPKTMQRLLDQEVLPNPGSWTAYWKQTGKQLPRERQLWGGALVQLWPPSQS
jgi:hypothetical protein